MGRLLNLNKFRKRKAKAEAVKRAETNRRVHGRTNSERTRDDLQRRVLDAKLDGAHLEPDATDEKPKS